MILITILEGGRDTGKTTTIVEISKDLKTEGYIENNSNRHPTKPDFQAILTKENKCIFIQSYMDTLASTDDFKTYYEGNIENYKEFDIMILVPSRAISNPRIRAKTLNYCKSLTDEIEIFRPPSNGFFDKKAILEHLKNKGF